ncbi:MAG: zinc ribbon domain-containing protein [Promethearchaeota archaeon]
MSDIMPDISDESTETQKFGTGIRWFGFSRIASILGSILLAVIASSIVTNTVTIPDEATMEETMAIIEAAMLVELGKTWALVLMYLFQALSIIGLGFMVFRLSSVIKENPDAQNLSKVFYLFLTALAVSVIFFALSLLIGFGEVNIAIYWIAIVLEIAIPGASITGYLFMQRWGVMYEQQMGSRYPILSSRIRRLMIGEILIITGLISSLLSLFVASFVSTGLFVTIGEVLVALNLLKAGKILESGSFQQAPPPQFGRFGQPQRPRPVQQQEYPEYRPPHKLIPDKAYFCPSCGEMLVSESADFCMKCGKPIPKPQKDGTIEKAKEKKLYPINWKCNYCGRENPEETTICEGCGKDRKTN